MSDPDIDDNEDPANEASEKNEVANSCTVKQFLFSNNDLYGYPTWLAGAAMEPKTIQSSPLLIFPVTFGMHTSKDYKTVIEDIIL